MDWMLNWLLHIWQNFLALHPWSYVIAAVLALLGFIKRKAIAAMISAAWEKSDAWFWEKMRTKLQLQQQTSHTGPADLRTYSGTFQDYVYRGNPHLSHTLTMSIDGFLHSVPVNNTHLFQGIKKGQFVEVDTEVEAGLHSELVRRVRVRETI
jgi:hypothetical protein